jgi:crotonobetainyl-CoA:carnitine CoA-transferase CaiB-like acyl-CoA transferase
MLTGINVLSLAVNVPGPVASAMLRDMGARVTKVEPPGGDPLVEHSAEWYADLVRGLEVVRIDLKHPDQRQAFEARLAGADILITATRPAALDRLGLDWAGLHARHPRLCVVAIVGYPAPRQDVAGHDLTYQAEEGLVAPPSLPRSFISDLAGAQRAVIAALGLIVARSRTGEGGRIEVSLSESARFFAEPASRGITAEDGLLGGALPAYNLYPAREGWVAVAALEPHFAARLQREMGLSSLERNRLAFAFQERTAVEWQEWAEARDLPVVAVRSFS